MPAAATLNQNIGRTDFRNWNICILKRFSDLSEAVTARMIKNSSLVTRVF